MLDRDEARDYVLEMARQHDVKFVRLWFTDILGQLKSINITVEELPEALEDGISFDGSSIEGFARADESDMLAMPDPTTFALLPWRPQQKRVARLFCDVLLPNGQPFEGDPRYVLKRNLKRAADLGYTFYVGPELEYFYFQTPEAPQVLDRGGYFDLTPLDEATDLRRDTVLMLEEMGIAVEHSHHEGAPSQHEIDLHYADALTMADAVMTARLVVKEVALKHGVYATFMPKPLSDENGSGMHINQSLFRGERNAFYDPNDPQRLSAVARSYIAGLLRHAPEITLVTNQWVNSYKRLVRGSGPLGFEAPVYVSWSLRNRADLIRVPEVKPGKEQAVRIEYRAPDPACNPYLAFAAMLAAGLEGIEREYPCPPPADRSVYEMSDQERAERGITHLPGSLWEAIQVAERSELLRRCLGEHVFHTLIQNKKIEWSEYRRQVTDYEVRRYLPIL
ncbi:MAG: glutamine synthetase family protein [Dehalococcoidia bacterium]|nr:glutamine synthetase family protein [Dehalococcoidia bacterium]MDW8008865.1 glutamine synthetase family protein [Chloroflexota bacterium]